MGLVLLAERGTVRYYDATLLTVEDKTLGLKLDDEPSQESNFLRGGFTAQGLQCSSK
jgi:hypothetical protein